jgi:hypothetical protein
MLQGIAEDEKKRGRAIRIFEAWKEHNFKGKQAKNVKGKPLKRSMK